MIDERLAQQLHAYHDGELNRLGRWRVERRIARDPEARAELARLRALGDALRAQAERVSAPDLWSRIVLELPPARPKAGAAEDRGFGFTLPKWAGAVVAAGAVAAAFFLMPGGAPPGPGTPEGLGGSAVQLLDTGRRPALILQDDAEATIILLLPAQKLEAGRMSNVVG
jgi:anti-sigma-K factor RskA